MIFISEVYFVSFWASLGAFSGFFQSSGISPSLIFLFSSLTSLNFALDFIDEKDEILYADSAYSGAPIADELPKNCKNEICEKSQRNHPLTKEQKENNRRKSKIRCRIEHVFGFMTNSMNQLTIRSIGIIRAWFQIGLTNLVYNFCRYEFLKRSSA